MFHNANLFGSCIIHILYTECAEIKKKIISGAKGLMLRYTYIASVDFLGKEDDIGFWKRGYAFRDKYREQGYVSVTPFSLRKTLILRSSFCAPT